MANQIIKGDDLMMFYNNAALAFATSHTFSISANTVDISSKDHGYWGASDVGNLTWEITTENLYTESDYDTLFDIMLNKMPVDIVWSKVANANPNGLGEGGASKWDVPTTGYRTGKAVITSLTTNANTGENATFSATFTGYGAITKNGTTSGGSNTGGSNTGGSNTGGSNTGDSNNGGSNTGDSNNGEGDIFIGTSVNDSRMGSVTGMGTYTYGTTVTLTATANAGYRFVSWGDGVTDNPRIIKAEVNGATYSAIFEAVV